MSTETLAALYRPILTKERSTFLLAAAEEVRQVTSATQVAWKGGTADIGDESGHAESPSQPLLAADECL